MNEVKNKNLFIRVSEKEKLIERNTEKCGLGSTEQDTLDMMEGIRENPQGFRFVV